MAGFLGLAAGGILGGIGAHYRQKQQDEQFYKDLRLKSIINLTHDDPSKAFDESYWKQVQKEGGFSPEHIGALKMYVQSQAGPALIARKQQQDFAAQIASIVGLPQAQSAGAGLVGPTGQKGMINFAPDAQGNLRPASAVQVPGAAAPIDGAAQADPSARLARLNAIRATLNPDSPQYKVLSSTIDSATKQIEFEQTKTQQAQSHADTEADRAATRAMQAQTHADSLAMQSQFHGFMEQMARAKLDEDKQTHFTNARNNLQSRTDAIAKMLSGASPSDPVTVKSLLDARNADARQLKQQAEKAGIDYDPDEFKPLTTRQVPGWLARHTGGLVGGSTTTVEAAPEAGAASAPKKPSGVPAGSVHGVSKSKGSGWMTPDGKFIPDAA